MTQPPKGFAYYPALLSEEEQLALIEVVQEAAARAPYYVPRMPKSGTAMSVKMTNLGPLGWITDKESGYRYEPNHPETKEPWPEIPQELYRLWDDVTSYPKPPEACLINWYSEHSKMGAHVDNDEQDLAAPVVSVSLGDPAMFRVGGISRGGKTYGVKLHSGDVVVLGGASRMCHHQISRIYFGESALVPGGGRINLTLRRVTK